MWLSFSQDMIWRYSKKLSCFQSKIHLLHSLLWGLLALKSANATTKLNKIDLTAQPWTKSVSDISSITNLSWNWTLGIIVTHRLIWAVAQKYISGHMLSTDRPHKTVQHIRLVAVCLRLLNCEEFTYWMLGFHLLPNYGCIVFVGFTTQFWMIP